MSLKEDIEKVKKKTEELEQESFAMQILKDYKKQNQRQFIVIVIILWLWFITGCYLVWLLNDIESIEETIDIQEVESIDNSHIKIGDDVWEKSD